MSHILPEPSQAVLGLAFLLAGYLTYSTWSPPNANLEHNPITRPKDDVGISSPAIQGRRFVTLSLWTIHALVTIFYPSAPTILCPNSANLSSSLFTWSVYSSTALSVIAVAAPIRLLAFRNLGKNFTFKLAKPKTLVKTGLYAYVQHPSYPTNWLIMVSNVAILLRLDGILGCVLPSGVVSWGMGNGVFEACPMSLAVLGLLGLCGIWVRVQDEEAMLKREFGKEWEEYHRQTKRFVPGVL